MFRGFLADRGTNWSHNEYNDDIMWMVITCTWLANGNTIFTSRGQNSQGPHLIEVTPDKKVVWVLQDWKHIGDATAVQILDDPGLPEIPGQSKH